MKQHITSDQLNKLTPEQRGRAAEILRTGICPKLSIGQCIELLNKNNAYLVQDIMGKNKIIGYNHWDGRPSYIGDCGQSGELIDALWQAVKAVL